MLKVIGLLMRDCYVFRGWGFPQTFQLIDYVWMREYFIKIGINPDATFFHRILLRRQNPEETRNTMWGLIQPNSVFLYKLQILTDCVNIYP